jgi:hypothetical protein
MKCSKCKQEVKGWVTVYDGTDILSGYEDCRARPRQVCISCLKSSLDNISMCDGAFADLTLHQDVMWKLFTDRDLEE